ncbi:sulfate/molybdate ABC transporter ATP-binding protein [Neobacillus terrae]|uniref:sulfate/molybdate ABC transporter ATP-binding protein n=1 Tax=Neobacillus terrae TaxID=3034837 RepID=UPI00140B6D48|nr:sulfate ABC transporter ATP-binding protein [Neobacillus terrae]NHM31922.1 sulfate ABC transporter ATP-binding protein [Neobacillus terrae]
MHIEVKDLEKKFGSFIAIQKASFKIQKGHLVGLLGPSGGGKTSLLRMLAGLEQPDSGEIFFNGNLANSLSIQAREIGFVFQNYALFKHMTVFENIAYGLKVKKQKASVIKERVFHLLQIMGLEGIEKKYPHQLSGGQRQRVAFARALAPEPQLLLLDEPFAAIDAKIRKELRIWLRNLINEFGVTTIFVTHDQDEAIEVADEIIIVQKGRIEQQGSPWEIYNQPSSSFVASFIGESNSLASPISLQGFPDLPRYFRGEDRNSEVKVYIRPEWIEIRTENKYYLASASEPAVVSHVHFRGDSWFIEFQLTNGTKLFTYQSIKEHFLKVGDQINILIHQLIVFTPSETRVLENRSKIDPMPVFI